MRIHTMFKPTHWIVGVVYSRLFGYVDIHLLCFCIRIYENNSMINRAYGN